MKPICNSCDTIDSFCDDNEMGYCRGCYAEVAENDLPSKEPGHIYSSFDPTGESDGFGLYPQ